MHEIVLYYMRERSLGNTNIQKLVISTEHEFFVFEAKEFERTFFGNRRFRKDFEDWAAGRKSDSTTEFFYSQIAKPFIAANDAEIQAASFDLRDFKEALGDPAGESKILLLFKAMSPQPVGPCLPLTQSRVAELGDKRKNITGTKGRRDAIQPRVGIGSFREKKVSRYSQLYIEVPAPLPDSARARLRLGKLMAKINPNTRALSELLGIRHRRCRPKQ